MGGKKGNKKDPGGGKSKPSAKDAGKKNKDAPDGGKASASVKGAQRLKISHLLVIKYLLLGP